MMNPLLTSRIAPTLMKTSSHFWETVPLANMNSAQWESLCDGCGLCCLHKLEDEDSNEVYYTNVACQLLDTNSCSCQHYAERRQRVPGCLVLTTENLREHLPWLPDTCAYKRIAQQQSLPDWHPLLSGDSNSVHRAGISAGGRCVSECDVNEDDLEDHVVYWVEGFGE